MFKKSDFELYETSAPAPIFSTILENHVEINNYLKKEILDHRQKYPMSTDIESNVKAWRSSWVTHEENPKFQPFCDLVRNTCSFLTEKYYNVSNEMLVKHMWCMMYNESDHAISHDHMPSLYSSSYYVDVEDGSSPVIFNKDTPNELTILPRNGMLLIWLGNLKHMVPPTKTKRMVISMNMHSKV